MGDGTANDRVAYIRLFRRPLVSMSWRILHRRVSDYRFVDLNIFINVSSCSSMPMIGRSPPLPTPARARVNPRFHETSGMCSTELNQPNDAQPNRRFLREILAREYGITSASVRDSEAFWKTVRFERLSASEHRLTFQQLGLSADAGRTSLPTAGSTFN